MLRWVYTNLLLCVQTQQEIDIMWQNTVTCHISNINVHVNEHINVNKPELAKGFGQVRTKTINDQSNTPSVNV